MSYLSSLLLLLLLNLFFIAINIAFAIKGGNFVLNLGVACFHVALSVYYFVEITKGQ